ncbi:hypothetical protein F2Q70_00004669 [Brassica cretica]|uniref:Uncharacterized protein n=1 Tax=Brassica cretica TaxID=69181 RepID=A0A8S9IY75_BRACR|nr:hypothetical protein F2Q68_00021506 [Brassica cretica]KAF2574352.1 hypothetical protein F2Q70_00004669 [Brassica cretica]
MDCIDMSTCGDLIVTVHPWRYAHDDCWTQFWSIPQWAAVKGMGLKGPEPIARIRAREGVAEVAEIVQQEAEIAELPQRSRSQLTIKKEEWKQKGGR